MLKQLAKNAILSWRHNGLPMAPKQVQLTAHPKQMMITRPTDISTSKIKAVLKLCRQHLMIFGVTQTFRSGHGSKGLGHLLGQLNGLLFWKWLTLVVGIDNDERDGHRKSDKKQTENVDEDSFRRRVLVVVLPTVTENSSQCQLPKCFS